MKAYVVRKPYEEGAKELPGSDAFDICVPRYDLAGNLSGWRSLVTGSNLNAWRDDLVFELPDNLESYSEVAAVFQLSDLMS